MPKQINEVNKRPVHDDDTGSDIARLAGVLESVLSAWESSAKEERDAIKDKASVLLQETRAKLHDRHRLHQATLDAARQADDWVHHKPWHSAGIGAAAGIILGFLLTRK